MNCSILNAILATCLLLFLPVIGSAAIPQKWKLDVPKTHVDFEVAYLGKGVIEGKFHTMDGSINYDMRNPTATKINNDLLKVDLSKIKLKILKLKP